MTNRISSAKEEAFNRTNRYENAGPVVISPNIKSKTCTERTIIEPLKIWLDDPDKKTIAVLTAPTATGKTETIHSFLIPELIKENSLIVLCSISKANVEELIRDLNKKIRSALKGSSTTVPIITDNADVFARHDIESGYACVFVTTVQNLSTKKNINIFEKLIENDKKIVIIRDEGHFGGSSDEDAVELNLSRKHYGTYGAVYYKHMSKFLPSGNIQAITFTATPLREMIEEDFPVGMHEYRHINEGLWPTIKELIEITSQLRKSVRVSIDNGFYNLLSRAFGDFHNFSNMQTIRKNKVEEAKPNCFVWNNKSVIMFKCATSASRVGMTKEILIKSLSKLIKDFGISYDDKSIAFCREGKYEILSPSYVSDYLEGKRATGKHYEMLSSYDELYTRLVDSNDPLRYIIAVDMMTAGLNIPNLTHICYVRERKANVGVGHNPITITSRQINGRASRIFYGIDREKTLGLENYRISDAVTWLKDQFSTDEFEIENTMREYMRDMNSHTIFMPDNSTHEQLEKDWTVYAAPLEKSLFNYKVYNGQLSFSDEDLKCDTCGTYHVTDKDGIVLHGIVDQKTHQMDYDDETQKSVESNLAKVLH